MEQEMNLQEQLIHQFDRIATSLERLLKLQELKP